jgi:hypothetical protein
MTADRLEDFVCCLYAGRMRLDAEHDVGDLQAASPAL